MGLEAFNLLVGGGTLGLQIITAALFLAYVLEKKFTDLHAIGDWVAKSGLLLGFLATLGAAIFSLVHSHYFGLPPCYLCWWQRIFIYPQVVLFALAIWRRDASVAIYSIVLSLIGAGFALYHHVLQMLPTGSIPCPATGPSCAQILFLEFGYITYPMLSLSLFAFLIVTMLFVLRRR
jgi:disulfide bond formation protein DsbB